MPCCPRPPAVVSETWSLPTARYPLHTSEEREHAPPARLPSHTEPQCSCLRQYKCFPLLGREGGEKERQDSESLNAGHSPGYAADQPPQRIAPGSCQARRAQGTQMQMASLISAASMLEMRLPSHSWNLSLQKAPSSCTAVLARGQNMTSLIRILILFSQEPRAKIGQGNLEMEH